MSEEQCLGGTCFVDLVNSIGLKLARNASRLDLEKEVLLVSISAAPVVTRFGPTHYQSLTG